VYKRQNTSRTLPYSLSIRTKTDGFSFCCTTAKGNALKELKIPTAFELWEKFENFVKLRGWAGKEHIEVTLIDFSDQFMVLPEKLKEEESIKAFFDFQFRHSEPNQIFTVPLCDGKQMFCWEIPGSRDQYFEKLFPRLRVFSSAYLLTNWTIRQASILQRPVLTAHLFNKSMQIFAANPEKLLFANTFSIKDIQEMPYYLLRCMDQLFLDPLQTQCTFCCESASENDVLELFKPYLQHISMASFTHETAEPLEIKDHFTDNHENS
jgi:hypothetical protein